MSRARNPFRPGVLLLVLLVGAGAFLLTLYALGQGWTGNGEERNGGEHGAASGLNGFAGLARLLRDTGHEVELSRNPAGTDDGALLVLTPPHQADAGELQDLLDARQWQGPTLLVLPKWQVMRIPEQLDVEAEPGWVFLGTAQSPEWFAGLTLAKDMQLGLGDTRNWSGQGLEGSLARREFTQAALEWQGDVIEPLVLDSEGDLLAATWWPDGGGRPVTLVFEPDLLNNLGLADAGRARQAVAIVAAARQYDGSMPVVFDLTLSGLGRNENLLTLAFRPPFLAATLCLLLAALVIGWRGFARFGPPLAEAPEMAQGKRQLALNGAALIARLRRWHLLGEPWSALVTARLAARLALPEHDRDAREAAIDRALARSNYAGPGYAATAGALREARGARDILRAARNLRTMERTLNP